MALLPAHSPFTLGDTQFEVQCKLGNGAFGTVYKVKEAGTRKIYALKDVLLKNSSTMKYVKREIEMLYLVSSHERIVKLFKHDIKGAHALILMEYLSGGNLDERLSNPSTDDKNLKWMIQMADALKFLHANGVVHRDLKADNVLLCDRLNEDIKLGDFGLAREYLASSTSDTSVKYYLSTATGPVHSQAPEVFTGHYTEKADVFSLGNIFHAIIGRNYIIYRGKKRYGIFVRLPEGQEVGLGLAMAHNKRNIQTPFTPDTLWRKVPASLRRLIGRMLSFNPHKRASAADVFKAINGLQPSSEFGPYSEFGSSSEFGAYSEFSSSSEFDPYSDFSSSSEFGPYSEFGSSSEFGPCTEFGSSGEFGPYSGFDYSSGFCSLQ